MRPSRTPQCQGATTTLNPALCAAPPHLSIHAFPPGRPPSAGACPPAIGRTLAEAGLRGLDGLYLTSVKRASTVIHAVGPDFIIMQSDVLFFAGELKMVTSVAQRFRLRAVTDAFEEDLPALMGSPRRRRQQATEFPPPRPPGGAP